MQKHNNYLPALDGIRAVSILLVVVAHLGFESIVPGGMGVSIFFYISGLLITNLLLIEYKNNGTVSFKKFYIRRILRLYPPILFMILLVLAIPYLHKNITGRELMAALFYYENYFIIYNYDAVKDTASFGFFWSLSVEEHFYFVFPWLFLWLIKSPHKIIVVVVALIVVSLASRLYIASIYRASEFSGAYTYVATICRSDSILVGCLTSIIISFDFKNLYLKFVSNPVVFLSALAIILFTLVFRNDFFRQTIRYSLQNISFMVVIPAILYGQKYLAINKIFSTKPFVFVGKLSYGLYLLNQTAFMLVDRYVTPLSTNLKYIFCGLIGAFLLATICYYIIEKPVMKWRRRFGSDVRIAAVRGVGVHMTERK